VSVSAVRRRVSALGCRGPRHDTAFSVSPVYHHVVPVVDEHDDHRLAVASAPPPGPAGRPAAWGRAGRSAPSDPGPRPGHDGCVRALAWRRRSGWLASVGDFSDPAACQPCLTVTAGFGARPGRPASRRTSRRRVATSRQRGRDDDLLRVFQLAGRCQCAHSTPDSAAPGCGRAPVGA